jgi:hypothetical protein
MKCSACKSNLLNIETTETDILLTLLGTSKVYEGKIFRGVNIMKNGCLNFSFCPRCGKMDGKFPIEVDDIPWSETEKYIDEICYDNN